MNAKFLVTAGLAFWAAAAMASPPTVNPEPMNLEVETLATIGKEKSKKSTIAEGIAASTDRKNQQNQGCGNVNINSQDNKSNSGIKDMFGKQSTTIVTGPVINMANCK
jgi:predicted ATPase